MFERPYSDTERDHDEIRQAVELRLDRNGDQSLDFLGGVAGPLRRHLDARRRHVGIRVDRQALEREDADADDGERDQCDEERLADRRFDEPLNRAAPAPSALVGRKRLARRTSRFAHWRLRELEEERAVADDLIAVRETRRHFVRVADARAERDSAPRERIRSAAATNTNGRFCSSRSTDDDGNENAAVLVRPT